MSVYPCACDPEKGTGITKVFLSPRPILAILDAIMQCGMQRLKSAVGPPHGNRVAHLSITAAIIGRAPAALGKSGAAIEMDRVIVGAHFEKEVLRALRGRPALPVGEQAAADPLPPPRRIDREQQQFAPRPSEDRKSTRLNSSH